VTRFAVREATARGVAFLAAGQPTHWVAPDLDRVFKQRSGRNSRRARSAGARRSISGLPRSNKLISKQIPILH
jgi:hypothetical protein